MFSKVTIVIAFSVFTLCNAIGQVQMGNLLGKWTDQTLPSSSAHDNRYNEIWGVVNDGREYAVIGTTWGTHFIDVTDPANPIEVAKVQGKTSGTSVVHRDYHDYENYIYAVCDEGTASTMQIIDFSTLPDSVSVVYDSKSLIQRAHNIFIDEDHGLLYGFISAGSLRLIDLKENPADPSLIKDYKNINEFPIPWGIHDAYVRDNIAYINVGYSGLVIADFSDPDSAQLITTLAPSEYPQSGYNHSGWLSEDGSTYYMADENHGKPMKILDVTELPDIRVGELFDADSESINSIPHNQVVSGDYLYVAYYFDGLQVYDISDPSAPKRIMHYPTSSRNHQPGKYQGAWGVYPFLPSGNILVSDMQEGLFVVESVDKLSSTEENAPKFNPIKPMVFPNPIVNEFKILDTSIGIKNVTLLDLQGNLIKTWNNKDTYLITENIPTGMYLVRIKGNKEVVTERVLITK